MDWIIEGVQKRRKAEADLAAVQQHAETLFEQLWQEVTAIVATGNSEQMRLGTNGTTYQRVVWMTVNPKVGQQSASPLRMTVQLSEDKRSINASSHAGEVQFSIAVCPDGVVCLKRDGLKITMRDAGKLIMEDFLFGKDSPFSPNV